MAKLTTLKDKQGNTLYPLTKTNAVSDSNGTSLDSILSGKVSPSQLLNLVYPIGSIYIGDENSSSPASWIGGTWQQIEDKFLLASGSSYTAGATGGEATHTLTTDEMPSHRHRLLTVNTWSGNAVGLKDTLNSTGSYNTRGIAGVEQTSGDTRYVTRSSSNQNYVENTGGGQAHNNMPPYKVVKVWRRTA